MGESFSSDLKFSIIPDWLLAAEVSDRAIRVYAVLARYADNNSHEAFPRRALIAQGAKCSPRSVDRAIDELVAVKAVSKRARKDDKGQQSNVYKLHRVPSDIKLTPSSGVTTPLVSADYPPSSPVTTITIPSELDPVKEREIQAQFDEFWAVYPKKADKPLALRSFTKALKRVSFEVILEGAAKYRDDPNREKAFTKNPSSWLNADAWENEPLPPKTRRAQIISKAEENVARLRELEKGAK
jgi:hypothetical protein